MTTVRFPAGAFRAVVTFYAVIHVPLRKQRPLIRRIHQWLAPGGFLVAILGKTAWTGTETSWLGVDAEMYWSHAAAPTYEKWLRAAGFTILRREFVPEGTSGHELFIAQKPARSAAPHKDVRPKAA
jgi:hypothetical protein